MNDDNQDIDEELQRLVVEETLASGRGERDAVGVRDQWGSTEHLKQQYDARRKPSKRVTGLLEEYRLSCEGCDHDEAVAKINAFVLDTKQGILKQQATRRFSERMFGVFAWLVVALVSAFWYKRKFQSQGVTLGAPQDSSFAKGRRKEIERQRKRFEKTLEVERSSQKPMKRPPTWREQEQKEVWTKEQERQFSRALKAFGGVPGKARYTLIADKVDGKTRQECLMHHKLIQVCSKDKGE